MNVERQKERERETDRYRKAGILWFFIQSKKDFLNVKRQKDGGRETEIYSKGRHTAVLYTTRKKL
jgi:hypothetical protein